jgi:hypothetical protein
MQSLLNNRSVRLGCGCFWQHRAHRVHGVLHAMLKKIESQNGQVLSAKRLPSSPGARLLPPDGGQDIRDELETILASDFFRGSKRCQSFLRFVVEAALSGDGERLKERTLGIELFDRDPAYDTGEDAIVRVKANEVRRRLAQYATTADPDRLVRIELPPGSYQPRIQRSLPVVPPGSRSSHWPGAWSALAAVVLLIAGAVTFASLRSSDPVRQFWEPVLASRSAPIICLGDPDVYLPGSSTPPAHAATPDDGAIFKPASFPGPDKPAGGTPSIVRVPDTFVGIGDSNAGFLIGRTLQSFGQSSNTRLGNQVSFSDLEGEPVVLVGAFSNRWTMSMTNKLRFSFVERNGKRFVADRDNPSHVWEVPSLKGTGKAAEDYAVVSRLLVSPAGQSLICVAGISNYGSQLGGEFVTNPLSLQALIRRAPHNWQRMNLQVVLRTTVVNDAPGPPEIVAVYFW